ncbi:MAG: hypothetical protein MI757_17455 [Pirellulales bacterium]|nr:hypothetical protein [Pirellulales bacterium]
MIVRTLIATFLVTGLSLVGCSSSKDKNDEDKQSQQQEEKQDQKDTETAETKKPEPKEVVKYEPYDAEKWAPDPGEAKPDAWKPQESEVGKATGSIFNALKNAATGGSEQ